MSRRERPTSGVARELRPEGIAGAADSRDARGRSFGNGIRGDYAGELQHNRQFDGRDYQWLDIYRGHHRQVDVLVTAQKPSNRGQWLVPHMAVNLG